MPGFMISFFLKRFAFYSSQILRQESSTLPTGRLFFACYARQRENNSNCFNLMTQCEGETCNWLRTYLPHPSQWMTNIQ